MSAIFPIVQGTLGYLSLSFALIAFVYSIVVAKTRLKLGKKNHFRLIFFFHMSALIALIGLILEPHYPSSKGDLIRLVTKHENIRILDSSDDDFTNYYLLEYSQAIKNPILGFKMIHSPEQIIKNHTNIDRIEIIGQGLSKNQWRKFDNIPIIHKPEKLIVGIINPRWKKQLNLGEYLVFTGFFQGEPGEIYTLEFIDPGQQAVAEKRLVNDDFISISVQPKTSGKLNYKVHIKNSQHQNVNTENINLNVTENSTASILMLRSSPSFEVKQFQNWAAENNAKLLIRSRVSKNVFSTRSVNRQEKKLDFSDQIISSLQLAKFDLLIIDQLLISQLEKSERKRIINAVNSGLGVIISSNNHVNRKQGENRVLDSLDFPLYQLTKPLDIRPILISKNLGRQIFTEDTLPISARLNTSRPGAQNISSPVANLSLQNRNLVESEDGQPLVKLRKVGRGKVALNLLQQSNRWVTSGNSAAFSLLWQHLIKNIARQSFTPKISFNSLASINYPNQLNALCFYTQNGKLPTRMIEVTRLAQPSSTHRLSIQRSSTNNLENCAYFWPNHGGWYHAAIEQQFNLGIDSATFFIDKKNTWQADQQYNYKAATAAKQAAYDPSNQTNLTYRKVNPWLFWWIFFISISFIWIEKRYS